MHARSFLPLLFAVMAVPVAHAEIYACAGKQRMPVYQNFPCQFDRLDAVPSSAQGPSAGASDRAAPQRAKGVASSRPAVPAVGMTTDEVRTIWGEPTTSSTEEHAKRDIEVWTYADSRSIVFDRKGIVTAIHW